MEGVKIFKYGFVVFILTILSTLLAIKLGNRWGLVDKPDHFLKPHKKPIPFTGGIAIFTGFWISIFILKITFPIILLPLSFLILLVGFFDDVKGLNPIKRLSIEIAVGIALFFAGYNVELFNLLPIDLLFTLSIVVGTLNAVNLIDGIDGLASGTSLVASLGYGLLFLIWSKSPEAIIAFLFVSSISGFFLFNYPKAKIFLGDEGSYILGFFLAFFFLSLSKGDGWTHFLIALLPLTIYFFDTGLAIFRRAIHKKSIFIGDRSHFYDQLVDRGIKKERVSLILISIQAFFIALSLFLIEKSIPIIILTWITLSFMISFLTKNFYLRRS